jgi:hypothetical protein
MSNHENNNWSPESSVPPQLSESDIQQIIAADEAYQQELEQNPLIWLPEDQIISLPGEALQHTRWNSVVRPADLKFDIGSLSLEELESDLGVLRAKRGSKKQKSKKTKQSSSNQGGARLPSGEVFSQVIAQYTNGMTPAANTGDLKFATQNALFGDRQKAITYADGFRQLIEPHHLIFWTEVNADFLKELGQRFGYGYWTSVANNRNQAVGLMAHPRLQKIGGPYSYDSVATVQGIPNLRPAYRVDFKDIWSGMIIKAIVIHLKSMRGGPEATAGVRYQQCVALVGEIGDTTEGVKPAMVDSVNLNFYKNQIFGSSVLDHGMVSITVPVCILSDEERELPADERLRRGFTVIGGDWNTILNVSNDTQPLIDAGYGLVNPDDPNPTQRHGSRLDGWHAESPSGCEGTDG